MVVSKIHRVQNKYFDRVEYTLVYLEYTLHGGQISHNIDEASTPPEEINEANDLPGGAESETKAEGVLRLLSDNVRREKTDVDGVGTVG